MLAMTVAFSAALGWIERRASNWQTGMRGGEAADRRVRGAALHPVA